MRANDLKDFEGLLQDIERINPNWKLDRKVWNMAFEKTPISHIAAGLNQFIKSYDKIRLPFPADLMKAITDVVSPYQHYKGVKGIITPRDDLWGDMFFAAREFFIEIRGYKSFWNNWYDLLDSWEFYSCDENSKIIIIDKGQMINKPPAEKREWNWFEIRENLIKSPGDKSTSNLFDLPPRPRKQKYWDYAVKWIKSKQPVAEIELTPNSTRRINDNY